jgi:hypothetical protein
MCTFVKLRAQEVERRRQRYHEAREDHLPNAQSQQREEVRFLQPEREDLEYPPSRSGQRALSRRWTSTGEINRLSTTTRKR